MYIPLVNKTENLNYMFFRWEDTAIVDIIIPLNDTRRKGGPAWLHYILLYEQIRVYSTGKIEMIATHPDK